MSGAVKSGLIFGAIGLVVVVVTAFLPRPGPVIGGPLLAVILGGAAGYYGVHWSAANPRVSRGVLAGTLTGVGTLIGAVVAYLILFNAVSSDPMFQEQLQAYLQQQPNAQVDPAALNSVIGIAGVVAGLCFGVLNLLLALAFGALGGWVAARNRPRPAPPEAPSV